MVASQNEIASRIGADVIAAGGTAVDAAVATAFALAVVHPTAGNIGGGGFIVYRPAKGDAVAYDFREMAPAKASPTMFMKDGKYSAELHHNSHLAVGVPGTVAGLHLAWKEQGKLPWKRLVDPAIALARDGFAVTEGARRDRSKDAQRDDAEVPGVGRAFTKNGVPYEAGRDAQAAGSRAHARAHRRAGSGRLLRRRNRARARERDAGARRTDHARGSEELRGEEARAGQGHLPRLRGHLDAAAELRRRRASSRC